MMPVPIRSVMVVCSVVVLSATLFGCSNSGGLTELRLEARKEQQRLDNQRLAGIEGGLARSLQPSVYAASADDTLANLLPGGETVFSALSAAIRRDFLGADYGAVHPDLGAAYVKSVASDGAGGFRVTFVISGRESVAHFAADEINEQHIFLGESEGNLTAYTLFSWTDSFRADPNDPSATDRTDGSSMYDYFDINGWSAGSVPFNQRRGYATYGVRTPPENLSGRATFEGHVQGEIWNAGNPVWNTQTWLRGTLQLEANLDDGEISGRIDELLTRPPGVSEYQPLADGNLIDIASTPIDDARFAADWVGNDPNMDAAPGDTMRGFSGTILGEFYGPAAEEIGGVLSGRRDATDSTPEQFLIGGFHGSQSEP